MNRWNLDSKTTAFQRSLDLLDVYSPVSWYLIRPGSTLCHSQLASHHLINVCAVSNACLLMKGEAKHYCNIPRAPSSTMTQLSPLSLQRPLDDLAHTVVIRSKTVGLAVLIWDCNRCVSRARPASTVSLSCFIKGSALAAFIKATNVEERERVTFMPGQNGGEN